MNLGSSAAICQHAGCGVAVRLSTQHRSRRRHSRRQASLLHQASYSRDALGRISAITVTPAGGSLQTLISAVSYYPFGPVKQLTWGNGMTQTRSYDQNYWINGIQASQTSGLALNFALDAVGNIRQIADANGVKAARNDYDYDALNRLSTFLWPSGSGESYEYDAIGNRTSKMLLPIGLGPIIIIPYDYLAGSHRLDAVDGIGRSYDANGNTLKRDRNAASAAVFAFDERNRYSAVTAPGAETRYQYNARGERVLKNVNSLSAASRSFAYDESGRLLMEANAASSAIQEIIWLDDLPVGVIAAGLIHQIQPDHLGSPRKVIQTSTNTAIWDWPILGNAFGEAQPNPDPDGNGQAFTLNLRFPGQQYDAETGLNYNYFRDYEPGTGRYVESDPVGLAGGISTYSYVGANPLEAYDPYGEVEHTTNRSESNRQTHESGQRRRMMDRGNERGDSQRRPPSKKPPNWKGPWPPKPKPGSRGNISPELVLICGRAFVVISSIIMPGNLGQQCECPCGEVCPPKETLEVK